MGKKRRKAAYVVKKGWKPGLYLTWDECRPQVTSFADIDYQGYETLSAAQEAWAKHLLDSQAFESRTLKIGSSRLLKLESQVPPHPELEGEPLFICHWFKTGRWRYANRVVSQDKILRTTSPT
jgi:hypothetical protein